MKSLVEKYVIKSPTGQWLANIVLDDKDGDIYIQSDYGDYSYWWRSRGRDTTLKQFLLSCDDSYVMNKFGYGGKNDYFYADRTIKNIKKDILQQRREDRIDSDQARLLWNEINDIDYSTDTCNEMYVSLAEWAPDVLSHIYGDSSYEIPWSTGTHPQLIAFMDKVWPLFLEEISNE
jgi:hypothetical protein